MSETSGGPGPPEGLVIGSRRSALARVQAEWVGARLAEAWPGLEVTYRFMSTAGDRRSATPLPEIGLKGLFTRDLERALASREIDLAVHSLKDLPADLTTDTSLVAIPAREDAGDVLVVSAPHADRVSGLAALSALDALPADAVIGTSSIRRAAQVRARRTDLRVEPVRGNVDTRLRKLEAREVDALVLAAAGLRRLGRWPPGAHALGSGWLPAPGQGALGVQGRAEDPAARHFAGRIECPRTRAEVSAERTLLGALEGGCQVPIAARARLGGNSLELKAAVYDVDGGSPIEGVETGPADGAAELGLRLADRLLEAGADELVERARRITG